jgi:hypothetical protein
MPRNPPIRTGNSRHRESEKMSVLYLLNIHPLHTHTTYLAHNHRNIFIPFSDTLNYFLQTLQQDGLSTSISPAYACMSLYLDRLASFAVEMAVSVTPVVRRVFLG